MIEIRINKEQWLTSHHKIAAGTILDPVQPEKQIMFIEIDPERANPRRIIEISGSYYDLKLFVKKMLILLEEIK